MIDPTKPSSSKEYSPDEPFSNESELSRRIHKIFYNIVIATNPLDASQTKRFKRESTLLSTLMYLPQYRLDPDTEEAVLAQLEEVSSNMSWDTLERNIRKVVELVRSSDRRFEVVALLMELERSFCISPDPEERVDTKDYQNTIAPLLSQIQSDMSSLEIKELTNAIRMIRNRFEQDPKLSKELYKELSLLSEKYH